MRPNTSFMMWAKGALSSSVRSSNAISCAFGRTHVSNGNRAAYEEIATNRPFSATTRFSPSISVATIWERGWEIDAPAFSPWFLEIRMYLNRLP